MARAIDVARYLIRLASHEEEPDPLTHLRLQKLLYYVQGWSLAQRGCPMFEDRIEAWAHGPVVPAVYHTFKDFGFSFIPDNEDPIEGLSEEESGFIVSVWEAYKGYSASSLRQMTHDEPTWLDARQGLDPAERCEAEITHEAMRTFFSSQAA